MPNRGRTGRRPPLRAVRRRSRRGGRDSPYCTKPDMVAEKLPLPGVRDATGPGGGGPVRPTTARATAAPSSAGTASRGEAWAGAVPARRARHTAAVGPAERVADAVTRPTRGTPGPCPRPPGRPARHRPTGRPSDRTSEAAGPAPDAAAARSPGRTLVARGFSVLRDRPVQRPSGGMSRAPLPPGAPARPGSAPARSSPRRAPSPRASRAGTRTRAAVLPRRRRPIGQRRRFT